MKTVELSSLIGKHKLSGVDFTTEEQKTHEWSSLENCEVVRFTLDGTTYLAVQDPSDGYRSCMRDCIITKEKPKNKFKAVEVFGIMKPTGYMYNKSNVIQFYDTETAKVVLEIGTDNLDDYYPSWVGNWHPENLSLNKNKE